MTDPIITEAMWKLAHALHSRPCPLCHAQARAEGRLAGMEEAARLADAHAGLPKPTQDIAKSVAKAIRAAAARAAPGLPEGA